MTEEILYSIHSLYRDEFRIRGFRFGSGKKSLCVVGNTRGNEFQQLYMASELVRRLGELEKLGQLAAGHEILVVPSVNPYSMNIKKRFWPTDNTDINRMFPGYSLGETTQRIAAGLFEEISRYEIGLHFTSFYMPGEFCPHVRIMRSGFEDTERARSFGLPYIVLRNPKPYDTTTLNYNWQIWSTAAYSLYSTTTTSLDIPAAEKMIEHILRFLRAEGILLGEPDSCSPCRVVRDEDFVTLRPHFSGFYLSRCTAGSRVSQGDVLAEIRDPLCGTLLEELRAPVQGTVFFRHNDPLVQSSTAALKLLTENGE